MQVGRGEYSEVKERSKKRDTVWSVTERLQMSQESAEGMDDMWCKQNWRERIPTLNTGWLESGKLSKKRQGRILSALVILQRNCCLITNLSVIYFHSVVLALTIIFP